MLQGHVCVMKIRRQISVMILHVPISSKFAVVVEAVVVVLVVVVVVVVISSSTIQTDWVLQALA